MSFSRKQLLIDKIRPRSALQSLILSIVRMISELEWTCHWSMVVIFIFIISLILMNIGKKSMNVNQISLEPGPISKIRLRGALRMTFTNGVRYVGFIESLRYSRTVVTIRLINLLIFDAFD